MEMFLRCSNLKIHPPSWNHQDITFLSTISVVCSVTSSFPPSFSLHSSPRHDCPWDVTASFTTRPCWHFPRNVIRSWGGETRPQIHKKSDLAPIYTWPHARTVPGAVHWRTLCAQRAFGAQINCILMCWLFNDITARVRACLHRMETPVHAPNLSAVCRVRATPPPCK